MRERRRLLWGRPFFGLNSEYKAHLHELIFDLTYYGKLEYFAVYEMPVQYRSFYYRKLINIREKEQGEYDKANGLSEAPSSKIARGPGVNSGK